MKLKTYFFYSGFFMLVLTLISIISGLLTFSDIEFPEQMVYADGNWAQNTALFYNSGDGSLENPFCIYTAQELALMAKQVNEKQNNGAYFILKSNIDLSGREWTPIGVSKTTPFYGSFDGQNFEINGLTITRQPSSTFYGLFGDVEGGILKNITFNNVYIYNDQSHDGASVGVLTGAAGNTIIENIKVLSGSMNMLQIDHAGSIIGYSWSTINKCVSALKIIIQNGTNIGGICGYINGDVFLSIFSENISIQSVKYVGGIAGNTEKGIQNCFSKSEITAVSDANNHCGNIVGYLNGKDANINYCVYTSIKYNAAGKNESSEIINTYLDDKQLFNLPLEYWKISSYINDGSPYLRWLYWEAI